jgi:hypothetical protein
MSEVRVYHKGAADSYSVTAATIATGWLPGQCFTLATTGLATLASGSNTMFVGIEEETDLVAPPTGSLVTGVYGCGTKIGISHVAEVAAASAVRAYDTVTGNPEAGPLSADLYVNAVGKWSTLVASGSVLGKIWEVPEAANSFTLGIILRF